MSNVDLRREHIKLLRFEQSIVNLTKRFVAGACVTTAGLMSISQQAIAASNLAAEKLGDASLDLHSQTLVSIIGSDLNIAQKLMEISELTTFAHSEFLKAAEASGAMLIPMGRGPKDPPAEIVQSLLSGLIG